MKYEIWNADHDGWGLLVEKSEIVRVIDNGDAWLSSDYEPEEILRQYREAEDEVEMLSLYDWLLECGMATRPEFFYSNELVTIITPDGTVYDGYAEALEGIEDYAAIIDRKGRLVFCDTLEAEAEAELELIKDDGKSRFMMGKCSDGMILLAEYSRVEGVNDRGTLVTAETFFEMGEEGLI